MQVAFHSTRESSVPMLIRPVRYLDLPVLKALFEETLAEEYERRGVDLSSQVARWQRMYPLVRALSLFPNPFQYSMNLWVAEVEGEVAGFIQASPASREGDRWHVDFVAVAPGFRSGGVAAAMLDHVVLGQVDAGVECFTAEVDVRNRRALELYARRGFRRYARLNYLQMLPEQSQLFAPAPPPAGLRSYRPRDAEALLELHRACTPEEVRLVDTRTSTELEMGFVEHTLSRWRRKLGLFEDRRYVLESDRRQVIGYLRVQGHFRSLPQILRVMVHPGYEAELPGLIGFGLGKLRGFPDSLVLAWVPDYQASTLEALSESGFSLLTEDYLLVRDGMMPCRPVKALVPAAVEEPLLKPAFFREGG